MIDHGPLAPKCCFNRLNKACLLAGICPAFQCTIPHAYILNYHEILVHACTHILHTINYDSYSYAIYIHFRYQIWLVQFQDDLCLSWRIEGVSLIRSISSSNISFDDASYKCSHIFTARDRVDPKAFMLSPVQ